MFLYIVQLYDLIQSIIDSYLLTYLKKDSLNSFIHECNSCLIGAVRSHTDSYKSIRDARVNHFVVETNKLLIRLDKLLSPDAPSDPKKRKGIILRMLSI